MKTHLKEEHVKEDIFKEEVYIYMYVIVSCPHLPLVECQLVVHSFLFLFVLSPKTIPLCLTKICILK